MELIHTNLISQITNVDSWYFDLPEVFYLKPPTVTKEYSDCT